MNNPKVTIIVPVYNVEKELTRCVESLVKQTLKDIEIILVNDGSTDNSPQLCDMFSDKHATVKVIHKKNGGLSDARNAGLKAAKGQYTLFVDSDDYISLDTCNVLYANAVKDNLDIVIGDAIKVENGKTIEMRHDKEYSNIILKGPDFLKFQFRSQIMSMAVCFNLYKTSFLINNELYFKKGIFHEDEQWTPRVFLKAMKVKYIEFPFYYYIIRENSITQKENRFKNGRDLINTCYELEKIFSTIEDKELKKLLNDYLVMLFLYAVHYGNLYDKNQNIYSKKFLLNKSKSKKNKFKVFIFYINRKLYKFLNTRSKSAV